MSLTYQQYTATIALFMGDPNLVNDNNFAQVIPTILFDAEYRICRDVDFLGAVVTDSSNVCTAGNRNINWGNAFFVVQSINAISPAGTTNPDLGKRNPILPANKEVCNYLFPSVTSSGIPQYFGRVTQSTAVLGPWPDAAYTLEITGTQRPATLSTTNQTTFISTYLPDLFIAASMIEAAAYQQNFSAMGDNPQQGTNWVTHYAELLKSADLEETRKKFQAEGWSSAQPTGGLSTPPRT